MALGSRSPQEYLKSSFHAYLEMRTLHCEPCLRRASSLFCSTAPVMPRQGITSPTRAKPTHPPKLREGILPFSSVQSLYIAEL
jgi:hypothetical protein